jgi:uncharacterized protein (DUF58 family)
MKDSIRMVVILTAVPIFMAVIAVLTTSKWYILTIIFPLIVITMALGLSERPRVMITLHVDKDVMYVGDELEVRLTVNVDGGFGLLMIRAPPIPGSSMAEGFNLVKGTNVHIVFKGFGKVSREFNYTLRAVKRGYYSLDSIEYVFYHGLGIHEPIKGSVKTDSSIQVLPRVKIVRRVLGLAKPRQGIPKYPPSRLGPYSTEFRSVRNYVTGDPYKLINWKATARNPEGRLMVNEYEREGLRTAIIIMDTGWWMRHGTVEENPLEYGISLTLSLSRVLLRYGYNVGLWVMPMGPRVIPSSGMDQYQRLLRVLMVIKALPIKGYVVDQVLLRIVQETKPVVVIITNLTRDNVNRLGGLIRELPVRILVIDVIPDTILMRNLIQNPPCTHWFVRDRNRLYAILPKNVKVITWDPACEGIGLVMSRVSAYIGRWL